MTSRTIFTKAIGHELLNLINEDDPLDEDIAILDEHGQLKAAIITPQAYAFFLRKVEETEDRVDNETVEAFHQSGERDE